jgi:hypothetical protein
MSTQITPAVRRAAKPTAAGIINIIGGASCILGALGMGAAAAVFGTLSSFPFLVPGIFFSILAIPVAILGVLAIVGGVYSLQRRKWGLALVGSIAALLISHVLGIIAIILIALSKDEFTA